MKSLLSCLIILSLSFSQKKVTFFSDSSAQEILMLESSIKKEGQQRVMLNLESSKKFTVPVRSKRTYTDSAAIKLISVRNATYQNLNWVRQHHDEMNNVAFYGVNPIGAAVLLLQATGLIKEKKESPVTISITSGE